MSSAAAAVGAVAVTGSQLVLLVTSLAIVAGAETSQHHQDRLRV